MQAEAALKLVEEIMTDLGLSLSPEKTKIASYGKGYEFLGLYAFEQVTNDAAKVTGEIQDEDSGN